MALAMGNQPVGFIVLAADLKRYLMRYIPFLPHLDPLLAEVANPPMPEKDCPSRF